MSVIIGLTGPTGAGKSLAAKTAEELNIQVIDCDLYARRAVEKGSFGLSALIKVFGAEILNEDETLNRKKLASIAFSTKENTNLLNETLLPFIVELVVADIKGDIVVLDAPTLFESGIDKKCDYTISVLADYEIRRKRIMTRDGLTEKEAELRMSAGKKDSYYIEKSDYVIHNNGDTKQFKAEFLNILKRGIDYERK
ncbi:MAG: dephospho-CoA kinase [Oscillospiraceae bacterium]|nr:dephospho-CoA kinase [Oscillospiraceae bacterium]